MRSVLLGVLSLVMTCSVGNVKGADIYWASGAGDALYNSLGVDVSASADFLFQIVVDTAGDTDLASLTAATLWDGVTDTYSTSDDVTLGAWNANWTAGAVQGPSGGASSLPDGTYSGDRYYIQFFNASTEAGATHRGIIYNDGTDPATENTWTVVDATSAPFYSAADIDKQGTQSIHLLGTGGFADGWQTTIAVPEPGTIALFLMGIMTFGARGIKRRKK